MTFHIRCRECDYEKKGVEATALSRALFNHDNGKHNGRDATYIVRSGSPDEVKA